MKKLILTICLTLLSLSASAEPIAYIKNEAGGQIIFTNEMCKLRGEPYPELQRVFSFTRSGATVEGCYYYEERAQLVVVVWADNGQRSTFSVRNITPF